MNIYDDITLIMVTYRSEELLKQNLDILKNFKLIIVDNSNSKNLKTIVENFKFRHVPTFYLLIRLP